MPIKQERMIILCSAARSFLEGWDSLREQIDDCIKKVTFHPEEALNELRVIVEFSQRFQASREALQILVAEETHFGRMAAHNDSAKQWAQRHRDTHGVLPKRDYSIKAPVAKAAPAKDAPGSQSPDFYKRMEEQTSKIMNEMDIPKGDQYGDPEADEIEAARLRGESPV